MRGAIRQRLTLPTIECVVIPFAVDVPSTFVLVFAVPHHVMHAVVSAAPPEPVIEPGQCVVTPLLPPAE